ncbi:MAG: HEAT repeat domain-containing protein [Sandaracinaceae bacterium]
MNNRILLVAAALFGGFMVSFTGTASAQDNNDSATVYSPEGEISPGTDAPSRERLMQAIESASPERLATLLEYGERVECHACVPLLERQLLESDDALVREMSAWWLRRRPFGFGAVMRDIRAVLAEDANPVRRARAAEAIGEFMDPHGVAHLQTALTDSESMVRLAAVRGLGRINSPAGNAAIVAAFEDSSAEVRDAAVGQVLYVNFFRDHDALLGRLADDSPQVRRRAALAIAELNVAEAAPALTAMLTGETDPMVRQAAAYALGRIGSGDARSALTTARETEENSLVRDAIDIALRM